jgi:hypothetical protein
MKRIQIVGLVLVAAFALGALVAAGAAQAAPEYGQCVAKKKGSYTNAGCTVASKPKKGKYVWDPGPSPTCVAKKKGEYTNSTCTTKAKPKKGKYEKECPNNCAAISATGGAAYLEGASGIKIECKTNGSEKGEILSATQATGVAVYTGCRIESLGVNCKSAGAAANEIKTYKLSAKPVEISSKVWVEYTPFSGTYLAEFECEVVSLRVKGSADGLDSGNVNTMSVTSTQEFSRALDNQNLTTESNTGKGYESPESSYQNQKTNFKGEEAGEIRCLTAGCS